MVLLLPTRQQCKGLSAPESAQVKLMQADNFAWFGFPDDTEPSSRDFVPGLKLVSISKRASDALQLLSHLLAYIESMRASQAFPTAPGWC